MKLMPLALPAAFLLFAACGGATTSDLDGPACDRPGGCVDGGGGSEGGTDAGTCTTAPARGLVACVPGTAPSELPITLEVRLEGCLPCFATAEPCDVRIAGQVLTLGFATKQCPPPGDVACPAICAEGKVRCELPPLPSGTYQIVLDGEPAQTGLPPRELVLEDQRGGDTSCALPPAGSPVPELSVAGLGTACVEDSDCALVRTGGACSLCACPNAAIGTGALSTYRARARAATALCERQDVPPVGCAACPPAEAKCIQKVCQHVAN